MSLGAGQAVTGLLGLLGFKPDLFAIFDVWDREAAAVVPGCEAAGLQGSRLLVRVPSTVHRQELIYHKDRLISRLNQAMGRRAITDIQFELAAGGTAPSPQRGGTLRDKIKARYGLQRDR